MKRGNTLLALIIIIYLAASTSALAPVNFMVGEKFQFNVVESVSITKINDTDYSEELPYLTNQVLNVSVDEITSAENPSDYSSRNTRVNFTEVKANETEHYYSFVDDWKAYFDLFILGILFSDALYDPHNYQFNEPNGSLADSLLDINEGEGLPYFVSENSTFYEQVAYNIEGWNKLINTDDENTSISIIADYNKEEKTFTTDSIYQDRRKDITSTGLNALYDVEFKFELVADLAIGILTKFRISLERDIAIGDGSEYNKVVLDVSTEVEDRNSDNEGFLDGLLLNELVLYFSSILILTYMIKHRK